VVGWATFERRRPDLAEAEQEVFGFDLHRCLLTRTTGHDDPSPRHTVWRADDL